MKYEDKREQHATTLFRTHRFAVLLLWLTWEKARTGRTGGGGVVAEIQVLGTKLSTTGKVIKYNFDFVRRAWLGAFRLWDCPVAGVAGSGIQ
eukprot:1989671-Rhodomonas_salina.1